MGWTGSTCGELDLLPAPADAGLRQIQWSTWAASLGRESSGDFGMLVVEMPGHVSLEALNTHSRIVWATSKTALGPYVATNHFHDEIVVQAQAQTPRVIQAPDGTFLLYDSSGGQRSGCVKAGRGIFYYRTAASLQ